ncbi:flavodoxin family protein, partial [Mesorhizobium sp. M7A.F.Ca.CA.001.12.2.1]
STDGSRKAFTTKVAARMDEF